MVYHVETMHMEVTILQQVEHVILYNDLVS